MSKSPLYDRLVGRDPLPRLDNPEMPNPLPYSRRFQILEIVNRELGARRRFEIEQLGEHPRRGR